MTQYNYLRKYQLYVGFPDSYYSVPTQKVVNVGSYSNIIEGSAEGFSELVAPDFMAVPSPDKGLLIEDLKVTVSVEATTDTAGSDSRKGRVKIYNLSESSRTQISQKNCKVIFKAGYLEDYEKDNLPTILSGQVSRVTTEKKGVDTITTLDVVDGYVPQTTVKINHTITSQYTSPISARDVLSYLVDVWKQSGISSSTSTVEYDFALESVKYYAGWTGTGYLKDVMDNFCNSNDLIWYITNSNLYVQREGSTLIKDLYTPNNTNIISVSPIVNDNASSSESEIKNRIKLITFLDGRIKEGSYIDLLEKFLPAIKKDIAGTYSVKSVKHNFSSEDGESRTEVEGEKI